MRPADATGCHDLSNPRFSRTSRPPLDERIGERKTEPPAQAEFDGPADRDRCVWPMPHMQGRASRAASTWLTTPRIRSRWPPCAGMATVPTIAAVCFSVAFTPGDRTSRNGVYWNRRTASAIWPDTNAIWTWTKHCPSRADRCGAGDRIRSTTDRLSVPGPFGDSCRTHSIAARLVVLRRPWGLGPNSRFDRNSHGSTGHVAFAGTRRWPRSRLGKTLRSAP